MGNRNACEHATVKGWDIDWESWGSRADKEGKGASVDATLVFGMGTSHLLNI
ncbi:uncharacterized protein G2W53_023664 [Senna tora]|uniref:Uncharacterized protein n=1 Tax=Senna tora TaxID=362788 RepID=A0A834WIE8_9FABA|nr:uncharacterized protein G2W53_023664 [Senna tora]